MRFREVGHDATFRGVIGHLLNAKFGFFPAVGLQGPETPQGEPGGPRAKLQDSGKLLLSVALHDLPEPFDGHAPGPIALDLSVLFPIFQIYVMIPTNSRF